jgi:putative chitinase
MNLTAQIIATGCGSSAPLAQSWLSPVQAACDRFEINTPIRVAAFLAQVGVESARLTAVSENLNYSAAALLTEFSDHFTSAEAQQYARQPQRIANRVYAGREGNGDEASGDGWRFRGQGLIQITFHDNYAVCGSGIDLPLLEHPELLQQPANAAMSAAWYWSNRNLNALADAGNFLGISKAINLGSATDPGTPGGYSQRLALYGAGKRALGFA